MIEFVLLLFLNVVLNNYPSQQSDRDPTDATVVIPELVTIIVTVYGKRGHFT